MKSSLIAFFSLILFSGTAFADVIADRKAAMRDISRQARALQTFARGETPYDAAAVMGALQNLETAAKAFDVDALFPDGSESGGETEASPKIFADRDAFKGAVRAFAEDIGAAIAASPQDAQALGPLFGEIRANCSSCHGDWRL